MRETVFFSHSSRDKDYLHKLKDKLLAKTSNTIDIFLSSDGESIPFGNNWVHKIEENLTKAKIMFVFISGSSLRSNWIYFESGFSYSKGVKVVPIGILGIDIAQLPPPINLLQGFNITSFEGLNNLVAIINREFSATFPESFNKDDYHELLEGTQISGPASSLRKIIDFIEYEFVPNLSGNSIVENPLEKIKLTLENKNIKYSPGGDDSIYLSGMVLRQISGKNSNKREIEAYVDQYKLEDNIRVLNSLLEHVYEKKIENYWFNICFDSPYKILDTDFKLSAKLSGIGIEMSESRGNMYKYHDLFFLIGEKHIGNISNRKHLRIIYGVEKLDLAHVNELIERLENVGVISKK